MFIAHNDLASHYYISDLLDKRVSVLSLRSNSQELLNIPRSRTKTYGDKSFSVGNWHAAVEYCHFDNIRTASDVNVFKRRLRTCLFHQAYLDCL